MAPRRELGTFACVLALLVCAFLNESLVRGRVLSPADVVFVEQSFAGHKPPEFEPANRLLIDPVLQFQPWLEFNRSELRAGRLPLWNPHVGCGAPHLAHGQSAVFDPFHAIAYLGTLPQAYAWMACARLWLAGLGMFLLARAWGLGSWGRWFAGLSFPFCGFLIVWLQYPVASSAVWMPWLFWATERLWRKRSGRSVAAIAAFTALCVFGGHIQTSAHVLLASGLYVVWRCIRSSRSGGEIGAFAWRWAAAIALGVGLASIQIVPLAVYLTRSPVWQDRLGDGPPAWAFTKPRILDAACTAFPYGLGSQRRGHPNLAKAVGVHNLNESAGGFVGLATLAVLAPLGWKNRADSPRVRFLTGLVALAAIVAFEAPLVSNIVRAIPVLNVIDERRLTLWIAFGLVLLGAHGIDSMRESCAEPRGDATRRQRIGSALALGVAGALALAAVAVCVGRPWIERKAIDHYQLAATQPNGIDPATATLFATRQATNTAHFLPAYYAYCSVHVLILLVIVKAWSHARLSSYHARALLVGFVLGDLFVFGYGLNPAIDPADDRPTSAVIDYLQAHASPPYRVLGVGRELPPNLLMRYGLDDCRNYDSVELRSNLDWFDDLYEPEPDRVSRSSRRTVTWQGVVRARDELREALVKCVVGATEPPPGAFEHVERVGLVWIVDLQPPPAGYTQTSPAEIRIDAFAASGDRKSLPVSHDPGWKAESNGRTVTIEKSTGGFLSVRPPSDARGIVLRYDPLEFRVGAWLSIVLFLITGALCTQEAAQGVVRKNDPGAWMPELAGDRIEAVPTPFCLFRRLSTEGRDTDGPLHV